LTTVDVERHAINSGIDFPQLDPYFSSASRVYVIMASIRPVVFKIYFALYIAEVVGVPVNMDFLVLKCHPQNGILLGIHSEDYQHLHLVINRYGVLTL
jgi:hypothetical protein